ncbi:nitroreductase family protein [Natrialba sp. INN-245]|uniref:nitroreductase family protein n=1 Tax=Natrialba sp. INN-245 TaxID=2690967 RepID=UPI00131308E7|nr:nitroreductase family protein [Natrialba sp. INN-245]MWV41978.1 dihydropteridine reductase [Natrialba sp. INN-245]
MTENPPKSARDTAARPALADEMPAVPKLTGWLSRRRTVREYDADATIPDEEIRAILDAGRKAPTSGTIQMYSFVSVRDPEMRARIHEAAGGGQPRIEEASHFFLVCIDLRRVRLLHDHRDLEFEMAPMTAVLKGAVDAALAAQGTITAAESYGYGVCPIGAISEGLSTISEIVDLPAEVLPAFGLCIGVPVGETHDEPTPRIPLDAVVHEDTYEDPSPELLEACYEEMNELYAGTDRVWEGALAHYWTPSPDGSMNNREGELLETLRQQGFFAYRGVDEPVSEPDRE